MNPAVFRHYLELPRNGYAVARVDIRGTGASEGRAVDEYVARGAGGRARRDRVARRAAVVRRPREHDGHLVRRLHRAPGGHPPAAAPHLDHPDRLHRRPLHRRLPLPRRPAPDVLRHRLVRDADDRVERDAARSGLGRRGVGAGLGAAPRRGRAVPPRVAAPPDRRAVLAAGLGGRGRGSDRVPRVPHRRLARRLPEPAAPAVRAAVRAEEAADRAVGPRTARCGDPRTADRLPPRGRPLARPLVPRDRHRDHERAAGRDLRPGAGQPRTRSAGDAGAMAGRDGLAGTGWLGARRSRWPPGAG